MLAAKVDPSKFPYANHSLIIDKQYPDFRVILFNPNKLNITKILAPISIQTKYNDGRLVIKEVNYTYIEYNDKIFKTEAYFLDSN
jgi:hypothetical protein